jgi:hypothetical protein
MKIRVTFTINLTETDRIAIGELTGDKICTRQQAKDYLQGAAEGALEEITGTYEQFRHNRN